jgi:hypothetical protein
VVGLAWRDVAVGLALILWLGACSSSARKSETAPTARKPAAPANPSLAVAPTCPVGIGPTQPFLQDVIMLCGGPTRPGPVGISVLP